MKVVHIITGLGVGGAELMLSRLLRAHQELDYDIEFTVISLKGVDEIGSRIESLGIEVLALEIHGIFGVFRGTHKLVTILRRIKPDTVQTWLYHADLLGGIAAKIAGVPNIIWGLRGCKIPKRRFDMTQFVVKLCARLSFVVPHKIVCCAESVKEYHQAIGYDLKKIVVIPNGYDTSAFQISALTKNKLREEFGISEATILIGIVGRFDPLKDHKNFITACHYLARRNEDLRFMMVGSGLDSDNAEIRRCVEEDGANIAEKFVLAGHRDDLPELLNIFDIYCSSSTSEGFPNVICEAMLMGLPCVVTDAGDSREIVQNFGKVVPIRDSVKLAEALEELVLMSHEARVEAGVLARRHIRKNYSIDNIVKRFDHIYRNTNLVES